MAHPSNGKRFLGILEHVSTFFFPLGIVMIVSSKKKIKKENNDFALKASSIQLPLRTLACNFKGLKSKVV